MATTHIQPSFASRLRRVGVGVTAGSTTVFAVVVLWLCLSPALAAQITEIEIKNFAFTPQEVTVATGTTVVWINHDEEVHTIIGADRRFSSKALDTDDRFSMKFENDGDYPYSCSLHPQMAGVLRVRNPSS